ncbi:ABC transporter permease [Acuticoccus sp. MNP-M23]|uniref:ABC transporter permease n=1 Tax=Acuticoccus sp. MNP-M23 TaxID=3072793 RepID=UPI0028150EAC|nr:ABC transporter permease [Acuticoccus sp. MNP-M23]WMS40806.1 ABC transporter permease [Acuticoccus sp. MNP-M23]
MSGSVLALFAIAALVAAFWTPHPVDGVDIANRFAAASARFPLGTDQYGRDVLSMLLAGAKTSLGVAAASIAIGVSVGAALGLLAAAAGGVLDAAIMRFSDLVFAFPALIIAVILATAFGPGVFGAIIAIGVFNIPVFARLTAASARPLFTRDFADAARLAGKSEARIALEHVAPNVAPIILTQCATQLAVAILAEASLSYVGLGAQAPTVSWGRMLAEAQTLVALAPQLAIWPGLAIAVSVFAITSFGETLRARLDPQAARR